MPEINQIPAFRVGTDVLPPRHRFDATRALMGPLYDLVPEPGERYPAMRLEGYRLNGVVVNKRTFGRHSFVRGTAHVRRHDTDHIAVRLSLAGSSKLTIGGVPVVMGPGSVTLLDRRFEMHGSTEPGMIIGSMLPRPSIGTGLLERNPAICWPAGSPQARLVGNALLSLWAELPRAHVEEGRDLAHGITSLIDGLLTSRPDSARREVLEQATLAAMGRFISRNLNNLELDAATLCRAFGCSRARLYRLFQPWGGVHRYIQGQRLQRCFEELSSAEPNRGRISMLAATWGFEDHSHLHRRFKARFGIAPSDVHTIGRPAGPGQGNTLPCNAQIAELHHWLGRT
ncbi:MAG: helix-turn-helix domain-containing protein [Pseudomonadota bacterium]